MELAPNYAIPLYLILLGFVLTPVQIWVGAAIAVFGLFLMLQARILRLHFTDVALVVTRAGTEIRRFPYSDWQNWRIFWQPVPILFYFKEVKSIHFLPIIFDPKSLRTCLEKHYPLVS